MKQKSFLPNFQYASLSLENKHFNAHIAQYLKRLRQPDNEICLVNKKNMRNIFLGKLYTEFEDPFLKNEN